MLYTPLFPVFLCTVFLIYFKPCVLLSFKAFVTGIQSEWEVFSSSCLHSDFFWVRGFLKGWKSSWVEGYIFLFFRSVWLWFWRINRHLWRFTVAAGSCFSHRRGRSISNESPRKFALKNIPVERANSGSLEPWFDTPRRRSEVERRVVTIPGISYVAIVVAGWLVTQASHEIWGYVSCVSGNSCFLGCDTMSLGDWFRRFEKCAVFVFRCQ